MPNTRISDLTAATSVAGTDVYPSVQTAGVGPVKTSLTQITAFALANAPAGALATPSIAPTGDTNTGFWFPAADTIAASTNGQERLRINSSGNVGIGTQSPVAPLSVVGNILAPSFDTNTTYTIGIQDATVNGFVNTKRGNLTIQASSAATGVQGMGAGDLTLKAGNSYSSNTTLDGDVNIRAGYNLVGSAFSNGKVLFFTDNTERMRITSAGNVGIGTTSPASKLDVSASNYVDPVLTISQSPITTGNKGVINFTDSAGTTGAIYSYGSAFGGGNNYALTFLTNTGSSLTEKMRITSAGNVLIGRTAAYKSATTGSWSFSAATGNGGEGGVEFVNTSTDANSDVNPPIIILKGSTTTSSSARFIQFYANGTTQPMGGIVGNGATNVQFVSLSDARDKENIAPISGSLSKIKSLVPVSFDWKLSGEHVNAGFTAQDVERVFPEFVVENYGDANGEARKGLTGGMTGGIIPHLVKAIQELAAEITALKAKNA